MGRDFLTKPKHFGTHNKPHHRKNKISQTNYLHHRNTHNDACHQIAYRINDLRIPLPTHSNREINDASMYRANMTVA